MRSNRAFPGRLITLIAACGALIASPPSEACTRALYVAKDGTVIVGRSMDWGEDIISNMWVLPRGMKRDGCGGKNTISWVSKYGSLIVTAYDIGAAEGMNEKGLVVNELALVSRTTVSRPKAPKSFRSAPGRSTSWTITPPSLRQLPISARRNFGYRRCFWPPVGLRTCTW